MIGDIKTDDETTMRNASTLNAVLWLIWGWHLGLALVIYAVAEGIS